MITKKELIEQFDNSFKEIEEFEKENKNDWPMIAGYAIGLLRGLYYYAQDLEESEG
jgi:hypothetical protein